MVLVLYCRYVLGVSLYGAYVSFCLLGSRRGDRGLGCRRCWAGTKVGYGGCLLSISNLDRRLRLSVE